MDSKNPSGAKSRAEVYDWIQCIIFALVFCVLLFVFAVRMVNVVGHSMVPTLEQSDKVVISNLFYHPKQGDVVVLRKQTLMQEPIVKRIIATEGQTVDIDFDDGVVYVDGSTDSRDARLGCVDTRYIMGRVYFTLFPVKNIGVVK